MSPEEVTLCLERIRNGDEGAVARLLPHIYGDLRSLARVILGGQQGDHTLQPTALVHEAYMRLVRSTDKGFEGRKHFMRVAALAMRQLLTDYARTSRRDKRGGGMARVQLDEELADGTSGQRELDMVDLDDALTELSELNGRLAQVVELRFLAGLTNAEASDVLGVSERTVRLDWSMARSWLHRRLG